MPEWSRRRTLSALSSGLAVALAGCETGEKPAPPPDAADDGERRLLEDYESKHVRNADAAVLYTRRETLPSPDAAGQTALRSSDHLTSRAAFEELTFGSVPEARQLRSFVDATDFETQSVYLFATTADACHEIRIQSMTRDPDGDPQGNFCEARRPADVTCSTDDTDSVGIAVRIPFDGDRSGGHGTGMSSSCRHPERPVAFTADVVPRNESDDS